MDYFAGLDISMDETHVCVLDREGMVVRESKAESTAQVVANELAKAPSCRRIVFETGRMAPILFHGLSQLGLPVVCVESRPGRWGQRWHHRLPLRPSDQREPLALHDRVVEAAALDAGGQQGRPDHRGAGAVRRWLRSSAFPTTGLRGIINGTSGGISRGADVRRQHH
jgi:hypothetical protein